MTPAEAEQQHKQLDRVLQHPEGEAHGHQPIEAEVRTEELQSASRLDPDLEWYVLGLSYVMIGIDRSLFEVFKAAGSDDLWVTTLPTDDPVVLVQGADFGQNPWSRLIQGFDPAQGEAFRSFVSSYTFLVGPEEHPWAIQWEKLRIADPVYQADKQPVDAWFALPYNTQSGRGFGIKVQPGLFLNTPMAGLMVRQAS